MLNANMQSCTTG